MNFLDSLFNPQRSPSMPINPPAQMPQMGGNLQRMTAGAPDMSRVTNVLQAIGGAPTSPAVEMPQQAPMQPGEPPRKRRSFLDTVGQISDVLARVGGAEALYQPTLDAREDRTRQIDLEGMRKQLLEQQIGQGEQTLQAGEAELADTERGRLATALGAIATNPEALAMWPQIAAEAGIEEGQAAQVGQLLQQNPQAAGIIAQSLGWSPATAKQGSQAKELQVFELLNSQDPELGQAYLQSIANPDSMSDYQRAQLQIGLRGLQLREEGAAFDRDFKEREFESKQDGGAGSEDSNSVANILQDFGVVLDGPEDPVADMIDGSTNGWIQYGAAMIPGVLGISTEGQQQIAKLETIDNALILALAGGKLGAGVSNADRTFFEKMAGRISNPTIPIDQRKAAWSQIKQRFQGILAREKKPAAAPRRSGSRPAPSRAAPAGERRSVRPANDPVSRAREEARRRGLR